MSHKGQCIITSRVQNSDYNYSRLAALFIDHTFVNKDDYIEKNMVELHVYVESNAIQLIQELPNYDVPQLVSDLGGVKCKRWE